MESVYDAVEDLYRKHCRAFASIEKEILNLGVPAEITRDTIKRLLVESFHGGPKQHLQSYHGFQGLKKSLLAMMWFFWMSVWGVKTARRIQCDVVLENWAGDNFSLFYKRLWKKLKVFNKNAILDTSKEQNRLFFPSESEVIRADTVYSNRFDRAISWKIASTQWKHIFTFHRSSMKSNFNFLEIHLRLLRYSALYYTDAQKVSAHSLISAADNYYNSIRYYFYKKYAFKQIFLIQNAFRTGFRSYWSGDMYTYTDYYLGFGTKNIEIQKGMCCPNKIGLGSLRLSDMMIASQFHDKLQYDIIFIEQLALNKTPDGFNIDYYWKCLELLVRFAKQHPSLRIAYGIRPKRMKIYGASKGLVSLINEVDHFLEGSGIQITDESQSSYENVLASKVVLFYSSTLGFEALGMGKRVLNLNLNKQSLGMGVENDIGVFVDGDQELFNQTVLSLIESSDEAIDEYFKTKQKQYMNPSKDVASDIVALIGNEITNDK